MASLKRNIAANLIGRLWSAALALLLVPFYIRFIGIEAYGLIGFYTTLLAALAILDLGLSTTLNRELAQATALKKVAHQVRNLVFTLECIYWAVGVLIALAVIAGASVIAAHWVNVEHLSIDVVSNSIMLMGVVIAFQWPISIYNGGLLGLERQVLLNVVMVLLTTLRAAGILLLFNFVQPSIELFFLWQAGTSLLYVICMRWSLWHNLPKSEKSSEFSVVELRGIWKFASGMTGVGLITFFLAQIDKVVLSNLLSLTKYGYYTLSFTLASALGTIITPIYTAVFPRFSAMVSLGDKTQLSEMYHRTCKLVATVAFPIGLFIIFFAPEILMLWTRNETTVQQTTEMVQILTAGSIFSCLISVPAILVQAQGNTRYIFFQNLIAAVILVPLLFIWTNLYGAVGASFVWLALNLGYILFSIPLIHKKYFRGEALKWYFEDTFLPLLTPLALLAAIKTTMHFYWPHAELNLFGIACLGAFVMSVSLAIHSNLRQRLLRLFSFNYRIKV